MDQDHDLDFLTLVCNGKESASALHLLITSADFAQMMYLMMSLYLLLGENRLRRAALLTRSVI